MWGPACCQPSWLSQPLWCGVGGAKQHLPGALAQPQAGWGIGSVLLVIQREVIKQAVPKGAESSVEQTPLPDCPPAAPCWASPFSAPQFPHL